MAFIKLKKCFSSPNHLVKLVIFIGCLIFAIYQVTNCLRKLMNPPVSTYYGFHLNNSMRYPAITICRKSPYKIEHFPKYGIRRRTQNLRTFGIFRYFFFDRYTIDDFLSETTWNFSEVFGPYSYNGRGNEMAEAEWTEFQNIKHGRCFTWTARSTSNTFSMSGGWWFYLRHNQRRRVVDDMGVSMYGFDIFIHHPIEIMTSEYTQETNFIEYLYLEAAEDLRVSLKYQEFQRVKTKEFQCADEINYSQSKCLEQCFHQVVANIVNCTLPWLWLLPNASSYPICSNYTQVYTVISSFSPPRRKQLLENCTCPSPCKVTIYTPSIISRKEVTDERLFPDSFIAMYYTNNIVTVMSEMIGYQLYGFVSDIGGSLGFLLGLSVIGTVAVMEKAFCSLIKTYYTRKNKPKEQSTEEATNNENVENEGKHTVEEKEKTRYRKRPLYENLTDFESDDFKCYEKTLIAEANRF